MTVATQHTFASIRELVGNTPLVELHKLSPKPGVRLFAKLESQNPTGSIKDRIVLRILEAARKSGALEPGQAIVEASTGNTGVALALFGRLLGHPVEVCVPDSVYPEIEQLLNVYGARIRRVPRQAGIKSAREVALDVAKETGAYYLGQFDSPENARTHYETTAAEILRDLGDVDVLVAGMGTGGTLSGAGRRLKEANPGCHVLAVEPRLGVHVQGLRALEEGFIPPIFDETVLDGKIVVDSRSSFAMAKELTQREGLFVGVSCGSVVKAAVRAADRLEGEQHIVCLMPDGGWKYLSSNLWTTEWEDQPEEIESKIWW